MSERYEVVKFNKRTGTRIPGMFFSGLRQDETQGRADKMNAKLSADRGKRSSSGAVQLTRLRWDLHPDDRQVSRVCSAVSKRGQKYRNDDRSFTPKSSAIGQRDTVANLVLLSSVSNIHGSPLK
jgi:hypothetical protein